MFAIARFEWGRLFRTRRGWLSLVAFVLVWLVILRYLILPAAQFLASPETGGLAGLLLDRIGANGLSRWQVPELALYWLIALYLLPFFCVVIAADQIASDRSRGTLRYLTLRASRLQVLFGRFLGHCLIQVLLVMATLGSVLALVAWLSPERLDAAVEVLPVILVNMVLVLLPYVALMSVASVLARSARQATLLAVVAWILVSLLLSYLQARFGPLPVLDWVLPGSQIASLLTLSGWDTLTLAPVPVLHTMVLLVIGSVLMLRQDL